MSRQMVLVSVLVAALVTALWWLFLYNPARQELAGIEDDIAAADTEAASLESRIAALEQIRSEAPEAEALIARYQGIVPAEPALPSALRQFTAAADDAGVTLQSVSTTRPTPVPAAEDGLHTISVSMAMDGSYFQIVDFLRRLEEPTITSRGLLITTVSLNPGTYPQLSASLAGTMFAVLDEPPQAAGGEAGGAEETTEEGAAEEGTAEEGAEEAPADDEAPAALGQEVAP